VIACKNVILRWKPRERSQGASGDRIERIPKRVSKRKAIRNRMVSNHHKGSIIAGALKHCPGRTDAARQLSSAPQRKPKAENASR